MSSSQFSITLTEAEEKALAAAEKLFFSETDINYAHHIFLQLISQHPNLGAEEHREQLRGYFADMFSSHPTELLSPEKKKQIQEFAADLLTESEQIHADEKGKLMRIAFNRLHYTDENRKEALESLQFYSPYTIFRLTEVSESFKSFCQSSPELAKIWAAILKDSGHMGETLLSIDNKIQLPIFNQFVGTFLLSELEHSKKMDLVKGVNRVVAYDDKILNLACDLGLYEALVLRCQINIGKLENKFSDKVKLNYEIEHDTRMFKVYWSIGYFRAAQMLAIQAEYLLASKEDLHAERVYREALDYFARAYILENNLISKRIAHCFHEDHSLPNEDETIKSFIKDSPLDLAAYREIRRTAHRRLRI